LKADLDIVQNESLVLTEISVKGLVQNIEGRQSINKYPKVFPLYETYLGDAGTNMSTSAMRLDAIGETWDGAVTETWGEDELPLLDNIVLNIANFLGERNRSVFGDMVNVIYEPFKALRYDGFLWVINYLRIDEMRNATNKIEIYDIGLDIPEIDIFTVSWILTEETVKDSDFVDANMRIWVNDGLVLEQWGNGFGNFTVVEGDEIRIQYFYLGLPFGPDVVSPALSLFVDAVLITETPLTEGVNVTLNHYITVTDANISINLFGSDISDTIEGLEDELESGL